MALIKLLILDDDDEYSFNLCNFLTHHYSEKLLVNYCSSAFNVEEWIKKIDPDILLVCDKYYDQINGFHKTKILFTSGKISSHSTHLTQIYKYKDANKIAGDIINSYINAGNILSSSKEKITRTIAVYSASGNVGKTSVALGVSSICSLSGRSVFYLNLEQFQTTSLFFSNNGDYSFSDIIYLAKEKDKNLVSKVMTMGCRHPETNISYFSQPGNILEINDLTSGDIGCILDSLKECGQYDLVVIDMDSRLDENTLKVFEMADDILYIFTEDEICLHKTDFFISNMEKLSFKLYQTSYLINKIQFIANKVSTQTLHSSNNSFQKQKVISQIPFLGNATSIKKFSKLNGESEKIYASFKEIAKNMFKQGITEDSRFEAGINK